MLFHSLPFSLFYNKTIPNAHYCTPPIFNTGMKKYLVQSILPIFKITNRYDVVSMSMFVNIRFFVRQHKTS